jgi:hypothetical protein
MTLAEIKAAVLHLDEVGQRRLMVELLPEIWPRLAADEYAFALIKKLVDEESVRTYQEEHMDHI